MNAEEDKVGCFQITLVLLLGINYVIVAMSHALPIFHNYTPKFYCQIKNSTSRSYGCQDIVNSSANVNLTFVPLETSTLASCSGEYRFVTEFAESSVVTEWGLICEKRYLSFLGPTAYYTGVLLGAWIAGLLADDIGRLPVQAICLYAQGTMAVALYIVQSYPAFLALRALQGIFVQGLQNSTYILSLELFPARFRTLVALIMQIFWSIGLVLLAVLSYVIPEWRILQLAISVPTAITVLYIWIIPESPRWLLAKGKSTEADMAFERIAKYNSCCIKSQTKNAPEQEAFVKSKTPTKPKRKSRVDLEKAKSDKKEATSLLNGSELVEQKITRKTSRTISTNADDEFSNVGLRRQIQNPVEDNDKKNSPSTSKRDQKSREIFQSECDQKISLKAEEEVVLYRAKKGKTSKDKETTGDDTQIQATNKITSTLKDTFRSSRLRKYCAVMICQWLTSAMAYSVLDDLAPNFLVNRHVTFVLSGVLEIMTYTFAYFILSKYGRRMPMCIYQSFNGIICILIAAFLTFMSIATSWTNLARTIMQLFGRVTVTSVVFIAYLYTVEVFPTVIRGSCLGLCVVFAKIGSLCIPHLLLLVQHVPFPVPLLVVGVLCLISGALALILPETLNRILPDQAMDMDKMISTNRNDGVNTENGTNENLAERKILREKLFSEDWVDAGNGILVNFSDNKNAD